MLTRQQLSHIDNLLRERDALARGVFSLQHLDDDKHKQLRISIHHSDSMGDDELWAIDRHRHPLTTALNKELVKAIEIEFEKAIDKYEKELDRLDVDHGS